MARILFALQGSVLSIGGRLSAQKVFLFFGIFWGVTMVFLTPPYHVPDEPGSFMRIYQISEGTMISEIEGDSLGGDLPVVFEEFHNIWAKTVLNPETRVRLSDFRTSITLPSFCPESKFFLFPSGAFHSPVTYFPHALGVFIGRILNLPLLVTFYLGRLFNLAVWIVLMYVAIREIPVLKWWLMVLALSPMNVFLAASLSGDAPTNAVAFLFLSLILKIALVENSKFTSKSFYLLTLLGVLLALLKNAYVPITLLWFIIPKSVFGTRRAYLAKTTLFYGLIVVFYGANALSLTHLINTIDFENLSGNIMGIHTISPQKQLQYVMENPFRFLKIAFNSYIQSRDFVINSYAGNFGWLQHKLPVMVIYLVVIIQFLLALTNSNPGISISFRKKMIIALAFISTMGAFSLLMYVQFNPIENPLIINLQGRYFIPVTPLLLLLFYNRKFLVGDAVLKYVAIVSVVIFQVTTVLTFLKAYYV